MVMVSFQGLMAEATGYADATLGRTPTTSIVRVEYHKDYLRGYAKGRARLAQAEAQDAREAEAQDAREPGEAAAGVVDDG